MALDINEGYNKIEEELSKNQKYKNIKKDIDDLKKRAGSTLEKSQTKTSTQLDKVKDVKQKAKKELKTQFDHLLDIISISDTKGGETKKYLKRLFVTSLEEIKPKLNDLLVDLSLKSLGCSQDQEFIGGQTLYIRVKSIDLQNLLKEETDTNVGKILYEVQPVQYGNLPFAMNKELYSRIQNINQPYSIPATQNYIGSSGQELFDITYVESYVDPVTSQIVQGSFFKVDLKSRSVGSNKVSEFLKDYYSTIDIIDYKNIFGNLLNILSGSLSIEKKDGNFELEDINKVLIIIKRIFGLCFDETKEIDVSGVAKVSENDNTDESFFEFTEIDLREIEQTISNIKLGVVEYVECDNVKLPVDSTNIIEAINQLQFFEDPNTISDATKLTEVLTDNPNWKNIQIDIDLNFLKEFPKSLVLSILSPKVLLPIMTMVKSLGQIAIDGINSFMDFIKTFKDFFIQFASRTIELFVGILFNKIKRDIRVLIQSIIADIARDRTNKKLLIILSLTEALITIAKIIKDFRECKSVIDEILSLLSLASRSFGNNIPLPLLISTRLLEGYSGTRAFLNVIGEFEKLGLPTGPMPDGSPNLMLAAIKGMIDGMDKEESQNGQTQIAVTPLAVTPIGLTIPQVMYGKKL